MAPRSGSCACHLKQEGRVTKIHLPAMIALRRLRRLHHQVRRRKCTPGSLRWGGA